MQNVMYRYNRYKTSSEHIDWLAPTFFAEGELISEVGNISFDLNILLKGKEDRSPLAQKENS